MTATSTAATPTPEELAACMRSYADNPASCYVQIHQVTLTEWARYVEAQAQHSEAQRAEIERLTAERDEAHQRGYDARQAEIVRALEEAGGRIVLEHGPASVGMVTLVNERAEAAEAALAAMTAERDEAMRSREYLLHQFEPYRQEGEFGGVCKQPALPADADDADRLARTLCDAINGLFAGLSADRRAGIEYVLAGYIRAALSASLERERGMREAAQPVADALRKHRTAMDAINAINEGSGDPGTDIDALWREADAASEEIDRAMAQFCAALQQQETA